MTDQRPWLILVGGFLGAGKTTLILAAAKELQRRGLGCAAVFNDQSDGLVDTSLAQSHALPFGEVAGGCFCCLFSDLVDAATAMREYRPDVIFAEPVGSCTDIVATTLLPLRRDFATDFRVAPFTVLVDPARPQSSDPNLNFLIRNQIAEAEIVIYTKSDLAVAAPSNARKVSAKTGQGIAAWLDEILSGATAPDLHALEIDYQHYAEAEAALAWLNLDFTYRPPIPRSPAQVLGPIFDQLQFDLTADGIEIVHLKATNDTSAGLLKAAVTTNQQDPAVEGPLDAPPVAVHQIRINLRALSPPSPIRAIVEHLSATLEGGITNQHLYCFSPKPPKPDRRISTASLSTSVS